MAELRQLGEKSRICGGLTTASGSPAAAMAAATALSKPPVASSTTSVRPIAAKALGQGRDPWSVAVNREGRGRWPQMHVEPVLGDIDADEHRTL